MWDELNLRKSQVKAQGETTRQAAQEIAAGKVQAAKENDSGKGS